MDNKKNIELYQEGYELVFGTVVQRQVFQQIQNLVNKRIVSVEVCTDSDITATPQNNTPMSNTGSKKGYLVLCFKDKEHINRIPLQTLRTVNNNGNPRKINLADVDWQKSYVEFSETSVITVGQALYFIFTYAEN
jgi:hypothetical protein